MEVVNSTGLAVGYTLGVEPSGQEMLVVVAKGTFSLPQDGGEPERLPVGLPLITSDTFTGEPGYSAPMQEVDFAPRKLRCDVLLTGSAHAPGGQPAERVLVGLRIGTWKKCFAVMGERSWSSVMSRVRATPPRPFIAQPISYDLAFGGVDNRHEDSAEHGAYMRNPVGRGWHRNLQSRFVDGAPLPCTEQIDRPVNAPDGDFAPMAFGPVGRGWSSRLPYAGTYDQDWIDNTFPFLPTDFQDDYYQAAPIDQQIGFPAGGEEVALANLTPGGLTRFRLPRIEVPVTFFRRSGGQEERNAVLDTIALDTDQGLMTLAWRTALPLKKNIFEIPNVLVGTMSSGWWRARALGKSWHPSLGSVVRQARDAAAEASS